MGIDETEPGTALIRCKYAAGDPTFVSKENDIGLLTQCFFANGYHGKRVSLSARLRSGQVDGVATIWMWIGRAVMDPLRFGNMEMRPTDGALRGKEAWSGRRIVPDVPAS